jgi:hypothetical protein
MKTTLSFFFALCFAVAAWSQAPTIAGDVMLCPNSNGTASITNAQAYDSYTWYWKYWFTSDPFIAIPGANGPSFTYDWMNYDQALLKVVVTLNGNTYESNTIQIDSYAWVGLTVGYQDSDNISQDPDTGAVNLCEGTAFTIEVYMPYTNVQWYKDGQPMPGENNMQLHVTEAGSYHVVAAPGFCPNSTSSTEGLPIVVQIDTNCQLGTGHQETQSFVLYPNPVKENLLVSAVQPIDKISVHDLAGQLVYAAKPGAVHAVADLSALASGMYFIQVETGGKICKAKIIRE